jgi:hypothetical protein
MSFFLSGLAALVVTQPATLSSGSSPEPDCVAVSTQVDRTVTLQFNLGSNPNTCDWTVPSSVTSLAVAVVGGGGGGGNNYMSTFSEAQSGMVIGGGGGAGQVLYKSALSVSAGTEFAITIGAGGAGSAGQLAATQPENGGTTIFGTVQASGGGSGGYYSGNEGKSFPATRGGSGGGSNDSDELPGWATDVSAPSGWTSFVSGGEASTNTAYQGGFLDRGGSGGGAKGVSGQQSRGIYLFDKCLATGGTGSIRLTLWGSPRTLPASEHAERAGDRKSVV